MVRTLRGLSIQIGRALEERLPINDMAQFDVNLCNIKSTGAMDLSWAEYIPETI